MILDHPGKQHLTRRVLTCWHGLIGLRGVEAFHLVLVRLIEHELIRHLRR